MSKILSLALPLRPVGLLGPLLIGELGLFLLLLSCGGVPPAALGALQLFLRF